MKRAATALSANTPIPYGAFSFRSISPTVSLVPAIPGFDFSVMLGYPCYYTCPFLVCPSTHSLFRISKMNDHPGRSRDTLGIDMTELSNHPQRLHFTHHLPLSQCSRIPQALRHIAPEPVHYPGRFLMPFSQSKAIVPSSSFSLLRNHRLERPRPSM